eukprot:6244867-Amphidinium_carterae.2
MDDSCLGHLDSIPQVNSRYVWKDIYVRPPSVLVKTGLIPASCNPAPLFGCVAGHYECERLGYQSGHLFDSWVCSADANSPKPQIGMALDQASFVLVGAILFR